MCDRFSQVAELRTIQNYFHVNDMVNIIPGFNIAPSQKVWTVIQGKDHERHLKLQHWGLITSDAQIIDVNQQIADIDLAMAATSAIPSELEVVFSTQRCLIVATSFFGWHTEAEAMSQPYLIHHNQFRPFGIGAIYYQYQNKGKSILCCAVLSTFACKELAPVQPRMPVIIDRNDFSIWLNTDTLTSSFIDKYVHKEELDFSYYKVSDMINNLNNNMVRCLLPLD